MKIPKMYFKQSFSHSKWVLQAILSVTVYSNGVQTLTPIFPLTVLNFVVLFYVIR